MREIGDWEKKNKRKTKKIGREKKQGYYWKEKEMMKKNKDN